MVEATIQYACQSGHIPDEEDFMAWLNAALESENSGIEIVIRIVDERESAQLNQQYRQKQGPTNVLSFSFDAPEIEGINLLGDLVICAPVVEKEASEQGKKLHDHWAHMVVHGVLHLLGYDHRNDEEAERMETKEIEILNKLKIKNPYLEVINHE